MSVFDKPKREKPKGMPNMADRMRAACAAVDRGEKGNYLTACAEAADEALWELIDAMPDEASLTFAHLSVVNRKRCRRWHGGDSEGWTGSDWSNAMCGEAGEAANVVKKLRREETGTKGQGDPDYEELKEMLANEIADVTLYLDLLADHYGIDVEAAIRRKFNIVSERQGFPERL